MYPLDLNVVIFNFSNINLSDKERNLLTLGLNFKLPIYWLNVFEYFLSFENFHNYLSKFDIFNPHGTPNILKSTLHNIAHKYFINASLIKSFFLSSQNMKSIHYITYPKTDPSLFVDLTKQRHWCCNTWQIRLWR